MEVVALLEAPQCLRSNPSAQYPPIPPLIAEHPLLISKTVDGSAMVTNFRFCVCERESINIPLMMVGDLLVSEAARRLRVGCKDGSTYSCTFATAEDCQACMSLLREKTGLPQSPDDLFAYRFHFLAMYKQGLRTHLTSLEKENILLCQPVNPAFAYNFDKETERLQFDTSKQGAWRKSLANKNYEFCPTYPKFHVLPAAVDDDRLKVSLDFRAMKRFPSVVWRDKRTGMVLIRSSQPLSSFLGVSYFTNHADVSLIEEIVNACNRDWLAIVQEEQKSRHALLGEEVSKDCDCDGEEGVSSISDCLKEDGAQESLLCGSSAVSRGHGTINGAFGSGDGYVAKKLAIVDCRSLAGVWGNSFKGGGTEDEAIYKCNTVHLDLANIHNVRDSFNKLRILCHAYVEGTFFKNLSSCMWLSYISALLRGANIVVELMHVMRRPVLVHCSDGWDRTAQIVSLSELMMDSYYRTLEGFQVLVEREWLHFGHKFGERGGHDPNCSDTNQISPIFLQFLDCVYQLTLQYPAMFQFNEAYLVKLLQHSYACLFGNFLHNCQRERESCHLKTASVWSLLRPEKVQFVNLLYKPSDQVLKVKFSEHDIVLWKSVYMGLSLHINQTEFYSESSPAAPGVRPDMTTADGMLRSKSLDDLSKVSINCGHQDIIQGHEGAAASAAAHLLTHHVCNKSSSAELMHSVGDSPLADERTSPSGQLEERFPDSSGRMSPGVSAGFDYGSNNVASTSQDGGSSVEASVTQSIDKSSATAVVSDTPGETLRVSTEQQCLNRYKCEDLPANGAGDGENTDVFLAVCHMDQSLVMSSECCEEIEVSGRCDDHTTHGYKAECCEETGGHTTCGYKAECCVEPEDSGSCGDHIIPGYKAECYKETGDHTTCGYKAECCEETEVSGSCDYSTRGYKAECCDKQVISTNNLEFSLETELPRIIDKTESLEAGLANPDSIEAGNVNSNIDSLDSDSIEAGKINSKMDNQDSNVDNIHSFRADRTNSNNNSMETGTANIDSFEAGNTKSNIDSFEAGNTKSNIDSFEAGNTKSNIDSFEAGNTKSNIDSFEAWNTKSNIDSHDSFEVDETEKINGNIDNPDISEAGNVNSNINNPDISEAGNVNSNINNPDISEAGNVNSNINNPDISEAGNVNSNINNPDISEADISEAGNVNSNIDNPDSSGAGNVNSNINNPDSSETGNANSNTENPDSSEAGNVNSNTDNPDSSEAGNTNNSNPDSFQNGNINSNIDSANQIEAVHINSNIDNADNFEAGNTNSYIDSSESSEDGTINSNIASAGSFQLNSNSVSVHSFQPGKGNSSAAVSNKSVDSVISVLDLSQKISVNGSATSGYNSEKTSLSSNSSSLSGETDGGVLNDVFENICIADVNSKVQHNNCENSKMRHNNCENSIMRYNGCENSQCVVKSGDGIIHSSIAAVEDVTLRENSERPAVNSTNLFSGRSGISDKIHDVIVGTSCHNSDLFLFNSLDSVEINRVSESKTCTDCSVSVDSFIDEAEVRHVTSSSTSRYTKPLEISTRNERHASTIPHASSSSLLTLHSSPKKRNSHPSEMGEVFYGSNLLSRLSGTAVGASQGLNGSPACLCHRPDNGHKRHPSGSEVISRRLFRESVATSTTDISDSNIDQPSSYLLPTHAVKHQPRIKKHMDVDGLTLFCDERQDLVAELLSEKDCKIVDLERSLSQAWKRIHMLRRYNGRQLQGSLWDNFAADSDGGEWSSLGSMSNSASDASWETVDDSVIRTLPWVSDLTMTHCAGCDAEFGVSRCKHHCCNCGKLFCMECSIALSPEAEFNKPDRVCRRCHSQLLQLSPGASSDGRIPTLVADG